jgi:hypothetical protein
MRRQLAESWDQFPPKQASISLPGWHSSSCQSDAVQKGQLYAQKS